jgi:deoxyadenosine/deoxycytidine kinase
LSATAQQRPTNLTRYAEALRGRKAPRYIAVEGPIGVGKTTLTRRLADALRYPMLLEPAAENPFLDAFYRDGKTNALPTQLFFLLHRARQMADLPANDLIGPCVVSDFLMDKDELFARLTLNDAEYALYQQIEQALDVHAPTPDLVIYLQAPTDVLLQRVRNRGIRSEQGMEPEYLETLARAYTEFFHFYDRAPLLIVNATEIDFANNDAHFDALFERMLAIDGMRQYFNPNPTLI